MPIVKRVGLMTIHLVERCWDLTYHVVLSVFPIDLYPTDSIKGSYCESGVSGPQ